MGESSSEEVVPSKVSATTPLVVTDSSSRRHTRQLIEEEVNDVVRSELTVAIT